MLRINSGISLNLQAVGIVEKLFAVVVLKFDDSRYVDAKQYHEASFSTRNAKFYSVMRFYNIAIC